jgi:mannose-1-phosphate guanylyltransferase/mannose-6-phosphate isomerase
MAKGSADTTGTRCVDRFIEKPPVETARTLIDSGDAYWNAGIFMFTARTIMEAVHQHLPNVYVPVARAVAGASEDLDFLRLAEADFAAAESISIDYGVMERADQITVMPVNLGWNDVGSWHGLWAASAQDPAGNVTFGDVRLHDCLGSFVRADGPMVVAVGLKDMVVITTPDAVLVAALDATDGLKRAVAGLRDEGRVEADLHRTIHRPWGSFTVLHFGHRFQVKQLSVKPGASLSLQKHYHRAEHWVVVAGTARVTVDGQQQLLTENESKYIPLGSVHQVENPGKIPLHMIEVQSGAYLSEDDIVRIEDRYARTESHVPQVVR